MEATKKDAGIDKMLTGLSGKDRVQTVASAMCVWCNEPDMNFRDALSKKEYTISGLCQKCQDKVFGE